jgi:transcriptional regulator with XRE-family HTH domain
MDETGLERLKKRLAPEPAVETAELFAGIAEQVALRRKQWGLSQKDLADLCGTTQSAIARLEAGRRPPRIDTLKRVASALDCDLNVELKPKTKGNSQ